MKKVLLCVFLLNCLGLAGQNKLLDLDAIHNWPSVMPTASISDDGYYLSYQLANIPSGSQTLVIASVEESWRLNIVGAGQLIFCGKSAIFKKGDSLGILNLPDSSLRYVGQVESFKIPLISSEDQVAYMKGSHTGNILVVENLTSQIREEYCHVKQYFWSRNGEYLLLVADSSEDDNSNESLVCLSIENAKSIQLLKGYNFSNFVFDRDAEQAAFVDKNTTTGKIEIWHYTFGGSPPQKLIDNNSLDASTGLSFYENSIQNFSNNGSVLFINLKEKGNANLENSLSNSMAIWGSEDSRFHPFRLKGSFDERTHGEIFSKAVIDLKSHQMSLLDAKSYTSYCYSNDFSLAFKKGQNYEINIISNHDGTQRRLRLPRGVSWISAQLSPNGKYVIFYNGKLKCFFSYCILTNKFINITKEIKTEWTVYGSDGVGAHNITYYIGGWLNGEKAIFLYDQYDIWQIDPDGLKQAINLTNGKGRKNHTAYRFATYGNNQIFDPFEKILISVFDRINKNNGYCFIQPGKATTPKNLGFGPYIYFFNEIVEGSPPIKSKNSEMYLVYRMDAQTSGNYFVTRNFIDFKAVSTVFPEKDFNWLTANRVTWKSLNGQNLQGILYKPNDFDHSKKYPVILYYYEKSSNKLNKYYPPEPSPGWMNIPWFVNRGYLVFVPDIHYTVGHPGISAYNSVVSAALYLSRYSWVDSRHMALQGHSFGAYETNYIITHSKLFAAAVSSSGMCDLISLYGSISYTGFSHQDEIEGSQLRMGFSLWQRPDLYIKNSPIFFADRITTPVLLMNNEKDGIVNFEQGVEFFLALRRLKKKAWLIQYDNEYHSLLNRDNADDFTFRMTEFYDYFLKGSRQPDWMTRSKTTR